jgi:hypothetical protein
MATATAEFTREEIVQRGKEIYDHDIRPVIEADHRGRVVAIDVRTGEFELADDAIASASQLRARLPEAVIFLARVGHQGLHQLLSPRPSHR